VRVYLLYVLITFLCVYAYRDWFRSLCALVLLMVVVEHPDMPKNIMGIQGLNPWNILLANVMFAWLIHRRQTGRVWEMPRHLNFMLLGYLGVVLVGIARMVVDPRHLDDPRMQTLLSEYLVNTIKWVVPGLMLFDGCRSRWHLRMATCCILGIYVLLALQVARWMPAASVFGGEGEDITNSRRRIVTEVGYHAVNMSMILAGGSWAILSMLPVLKRRWKQVLVVAAALAAMYGQALTGGRMGYLTWGAVGLVLCTLRWRKYLLLAPLVPFLLALVLPGAAERMIHGMGQASITGETVTDEYKVTSGRTLIWPYAIDKIMESPVIGHGRQAMNRTGLRNTLRKQLHEDFGHPHNAYLEILLDNGVLGFLVIIPFYLVIVAGSIRLFMDRGDPWCVAIGGMTLSLVLALLVASLGSQTFYPREGAVGMWAAIGLMVRMSLEQKRATAGRLLRPGVRVPGPVRLAYTAPRTTIMLGGRR